MSYVYNILSRILDWCYNLLGNYVWAIVLFTFITKLVLFPVTIWVQKNSIKLIRLTPEINRLKIKYFGDKDTIGEKEQELYKANGYNAFASVVPALIQIFLLIGIIGTIHQKVDSGDSDLIIGALDLGAIPIESGGLYLLLPLLAGVSAFLLSWSQNRANILQSESGNGMKYGTAAVSVGISLFLGFYVQTAVVIYWIASNVFSTVQQYVVNALIPPKKYIDFEELEQTKKELSALESLGGDGGKRRDRGLVKRERQDYKKFFSVVNKHLVFYSESNGFYKYFKGFIEYILDHTNLTIHYITSDPDDHIFTMAQENPQIRPYYIGEKRLITLMMKMDSDIVVMTMPDLETYHIKRSYVRKDIEYIYVQHDMNSKSLMMRKGCMDHFDTVFCAGQHQYDEIRDTEKLYGLSEKNLIEVGYPLIDEIKKSYEQSDHPVNLRKKVLIAPSWQKDNIIDSCLEGILDGLKDGDYEIIVRPHPQEVRLKHEYMESLKLKYKDAGNIEIQTDFSSNNPIMEADLLITDWSGICWEYALTTLRPVLFIDTPMKVMNPEYDRIPTVPINILVRDQIGKRLSPDALDDLKESVEYLLDHADLYREEIDDFSRRYMYNPDRSAEVGAQYIISQIQKKVSEKKSQ